MDGTALTPIFNSSNGWINLPKEKIDKEDFIKKVYENVNDLKIPLIDERYYNKITMKPAQVSVFFKYEGDEKVIRGFLGLADYFKTVVLRKKETFYIPVMNMTFELSC